jgi:hypothetical protein
VKVIPKLVIDNEAAAWLFVLTPLIPCICIIIVFESVVIAPSDTC